MGQIKILMIVNGIEESDKGKSISIIIVKPLVNSLIKNENKLFPKTAFFLLASIPRQTCWLRERETSNSIHA